jgi:hypothetical protein
MPADDATGPTGRAASIGFFANADDSPRIASGGMRPSRDRPADGPDVAVGAPRGSVVVVVLATLLLAGTAIGFAWTLTPAGRQAPASGPASAPAQRPHEAPLAAELQAPTPAPPPTVEVRAPAQPELAPHHRALAAQALKPAAHHPIRHAGARRRHRAATDLADTYARAIAELDRRQAQAAGGDPPF